MIRIMKGSVSDSIESVKNVGRIFSTEKKLPRAKYFRGWMQRVPHIRVNSDGSLKIDSELIYGRKWSRDIYGPPLRMPKAAK